MLNTTQIFSQGATFIDHGFIPDSLQAGMDAEFQSALYNDGHVFVATTKGIWKNRLIDKQWSKSGLQGKIITALHKHPSVINTFFAGVKSNYTDTAKTCYISNDGGSSWHAAQSPVFLDQENRYENYICFAVRPGYPEYIYCNTEGGNSIVISTDGGEHWVRMNNMQEPMFGYQCNIAFLPNEANSILQGGELPLDDAWLGKYDIYLTKPDSLYNFKKIVDISVIENRRPTELKVYPYTNQNIYIGHEGALSKFDGANHKFIYKSQSEPQKPYSYIYAIWVDPDDTNHIVFGGAKNSETQPMQIYETFDEGLTFHWYTDMLGLIKPDIREIISTNTYPAILIDDRSQKRVKLVLFKPDNKTLVEESLLNNKIKIYPSITTDLIYIDFGDIQLSSIDLVIYNFIGQIVLRQQPGRIQNEIDLSSFSSGVYFLEFFIDEQRIVKKLLKVDRY